jgi:ABC-type nickel/cobalt efflux system permease component RcnA
MTTLLPILTLGFFLGLRHATDPDHVIAVTTIVARQRTAAGAAAIGAAWGVGHMLTMLVVGSGIIVFGWVIPPRVGLSTELCVGLMLILLGLMTLTGAVRRLGVDARDAHAGDRHGAHEHPHAHVHAHGHGDYIHIHAHSHDPESHPHRPDATPLGWLDRHFGALAPYRLVRPLVVGIVHGLAGSAAIALLVLTTIREPGLAVLYLLIFGLGTICGMMAMTAAIVFPFAYTNREFTRFNKGLRIASGVLSVGFGLFIAYRIGLVDGLFTGHPRWTPE